MFIFTIVVCRLLSGEIKSVQVSKPNGSQNKPPIMRRKARYIREISQACLYILSCLTAAIFCEFINTKLISIQYAILSVLNEYNIIVAIAYKA